MSGCLLLWAIDLILSLVAIVVDAVQQVKAKRKALPPAPEETPRRAKWWQLWR
jgi:hypothetical protein